MFFKIAQNINKHLGNLCKKICHRELSKIAPSGHTGQDTLFKVHCFGQHLFLYQILFIKGNKNRTGFERMLA